jgi:hypothetical protein
LADARAANCPPVRSLIERRDANPLAGELDAIVTAITTSTQIFIEVLNAAMDTRHTPTKSAA